MLRQTTLVFATLALCGAAFAQNNIRQDGVFQIGYAANLNVGDSVVNITNDGFVGAFFGATPATKGNLCANVYVFDPQEEEIACCSCLVTPNGLVSLSAKQDLVGNPLTPVTPTSIVIKLVGSSPYIDTTGKATICNPALVWTGTVTFPGGFNPPGLTPDGLLAWGTTQEPGSTPGTYSPVQVPFLQAGSGLDTGNATANIACGATTCTATYTNTGNELAALTSVCSFIQSDGTGFGICNSCRTGALAGAKQ